MREIILFEGNEPLINYKSRTFTKGVELDMVYNFIDKYKKNNQESNLAFFLEPHLTNGYPDVVIVHYDNFTLDVENNNRLELSEIDLKILFEVNRVRRCSVQYLSKHLGYKDAVIRKAITNLSESGMILNTKKSNIIKAKNIKTFFNIKKIVSVEAKIDKMSEVFSQSYANQWFSGESYICINRIIDNQWVQKCSEEGMGVYVEKSNNFRKVLKSEKRKLPVSYASLLFNEWIYRKKVMEIKNAFC